MTDVIAGIGLAQMERYPEMLKRRKDIITRYDAAFKPIGIKVLDIKDYPNAYDHFVNEVTLPLHTNLTDEEVDYIIENYSKIVKDYL